MTGRRPILPMTRRCFLRAGSGGVLLVVAGGGLPLGCGPVETGWARAQVLSDPALCGACGRCAITCSALHGGGPGAAHALVGPDSIYQELQFEDAGWSAASCRMCPEVDGDGGRAEPTCVAVCPQGAAQIAPWGDPVYGDTRVRFIDPELCIGCGLCGMHCPYEHPLLDGAVSRKCDACVGRHEIPPCVDACPSSALLFLDVWHANPPRPFPWEAE